MVDAPASPTRLVVRLAIDPGEPMAGTVAVEGSTAEETRFCGWIELMSAITTARSGSAPRA